MGFTPDARSRVAAVPEVAQANCRQTGALGETAEELCESVGIDRPPVRLGEDQAVVLPARAPGLAFLSLPSAPSAERFDGMRVEVDGAAAAARLRLRELGVPVDRHVGLANRGPRCVEVDVFPAQPRSSPRRIPVVLRVSQAAESR